MAVVRLQTLGGRWETVGRDRLRGIHPQGLNLTATRRGSDTARFTLKRDPGTPHPDLASWTPCEVEVNGKKVWSGRVVETPGQDGEDRQISVEGRGWHYHLDDDVEEKFYVRTDMSSWRDTRSNIDADLNQFRPVGMVEVGQGGIVVGFPNASTVVVPYAAGAELDLGPSNVMTRVTLDLEIVNPWPEFQFIVRSHAVSGAAGSGVGSFSTALSVQHDVMTSGLQSYSFSTGYRYITVLLYRHVGSSVTGGDHLVKIKALRLYKTSAYESGNASVLKASTVVIDTNSTALLPLLGNTVYTATSFNIPDFAPQGLKTPREKIEAVNAFHHYDYGVDVEKRLYFLPPPSAPVYAIGSWAGADFRDASLGSAEEVYNRVYVEGSGPDGEPIRVLRSQTGTIVDKRGFNRTKILSIGGALTTAAANQLGDVYLAAHRLQPFKGDITIHGQGGVRRVRGGADVHPSELLLGARELIRLTDKIDPDTGGLGRDGVIASVTYDDDTETAQVSLDSQRDNLEALIARFAAVVG